jgi:putative SOS response-associated peptidase YedK
MPMHSASVQWNSERSKEMCGRFALFASGEQLAERYPFVEVPQLASRYNIAPTQRVLAVRATDKGQEAALLRWGLIPSWSRDAAIGNKLLNARAETVAEKPSFRSAFKKRRCVLPASGFYEWQKQGIGRKQPYFIRPGDGGVFAFAGLWESWHDPEGEIFETCTIITTTANELMRPIHDRMPVILDPTLEGQWLDSGASGDALHSLLLPYASERMQTDPVSTWVNNVKNQGPKCLEPLRA